MHTNEISSEMRLKNGAGLKMVFDINFHPILHEAKAGEVLNFDNFPVFSCQKF